jgi:hypothetical protein
MLAYKPLLYLFTTVACTKPTRSSCAYLLKCRGYPNSSYVGEIGMCPRFPYFSKPISYMNPIPNSFTDSPQTAQTLDVLLPNLHKIPAIHAVLKIDI